LRDAEVAALTLNIFQRHSDRVKLAAIAQMVNVLQAMILTDKDKMLLTPTYHVFDMYQPFMGAVPYPAAVSGPDYVSGDTHLPMVDVSAARTKDGKLVISIVNTNPGHAVQVVTNLTGSAHGRILTAIAMDAHNTLRCAQYGASVAVPEQHGRGKNVFRYAVEISRRGDGGLIAVAARRLCSGRSALKSIHRINLPGYAGRASFFECRPSPCRGDGGLSYFALNL
jgi:alpha-N-arabinofuranosidase